MFRNLNRLVLVIALFLSSLSSLAISDVLNAAPASAVTCPTGQMPGGRGGQSCVDVPSTGCPAGQTKVRQSCEAIPDSDNCPTGQVPGAGGGGCIDVGQATHSANQSTGTNTVTESANGSALTAAPNYGDLHPDASALPGGAEAQSMLGGLMFYAILFTLAGMMVSMGVWAVGSFSSNYTQAVNGKRSALICMGSAFFIGAAYALVNWFYTKGTTVS